MRPPAARNGNLLLDYLLGARVVFSGDRTREAVAEELAREFNGVALADVPDPKDPTKFLAREGEQLPRASAHPVLAYGDAVLRRLVGCEGKAFRQSTAFGKPRAPAPFIVYGWPRCRGV